MLLDQYQGTAPLAVYVFVMRKISNALHTATTPAANILPITAVGNAAEWCRSTSGDGIAGFALGSNLRHRRVYAKDGPGDEHWQDSDEVSPSTNTSAAAKLGATPRIPTLFLFLLLTTTCVLLTLCQVLQQSSPYSNLEKSSQGCSPPTASPLSPSFPHRQHRKQSFHRGHNLHTPNN